MRCPYVEIQDKKNKVLPKTDIIKKELKYLQKKKNYKSMITHHTPAGQVVSHLSLFASL